MPDAQHPLLRDPERARAFELIVTGQASTLRAWAELLGWSLPRVQRFVNTLEREQLARVHRSRWGTSLTRYAPDTHPIQPPGAEADTHPTHGRYAPDTPPIRLGTRKLDQLPRSRAGTEFAADLIDALNGALLARFGEESPLILYDNRSSNAAANRLERLGVDIAWAAKQLWTDVQLFHPEKHGNGQGYPKSLAYFEKGLTKRWRERPDPDQLAAARLVMAIERGEGKPQPRGGKPVPIAEMMAHLRAESGGSK
jgi:hypothetical protein